MSSETNQTASPSWLRTILIGRQPRFTLVRIVGLVLITFVTFKFVLVPIRIGGPSMLPTYRENNINVVNRLAYRWREPQRGDVVAIRMAGEHMMYMKRIIGLPGEQLEFSGGRLLINGREVDEPYVKYECRWTFRPREGPLGPDEFYVVGDNRSMRHKDHTQGVAARYRIVGKVLL
jgi:signal peptidase I